MESRGRQREIGKGLCNHNKYGKVKYKSILGKIESWNFGKRVLNIVTLKDIINVFY